tara:strand:- start:16 stop:1137 length:1122 start_codon:yes stop_codon:yes gene_type:complete
MAYTTIDNPADHFNTLLWTGDIVDSDGTGHDQAVTGVGFQPDWVWHKCRSHANQHIWADSIRGQGGSPTQMLGLASQDNGAETTVNTNGWIESLDSDGYTVTSGNDSSSKSNNAGANGRTYVGWCWKCSTAFSNDASATSVGSIDSSGKINADAGIAIITWTGTGSAGTIAHGLAAVPKFIMVKNRTDSSTDWYCYHQANGNTHSILLNSTGAKVGAYSDNWNNTSPTSTVFSVGSSNSTGGSSSDNMIAYIFADVKGYSKVGSYTGNGNADGTFIHTGFRPAWIIIKRSSSSGSNWHMHDTKRDPFNIVSADLYADVGVAEDDSTDRLDILSNGIKIKTSNGAYNTSGATYIYMAFAESPFVNSNGIPNNAR